ncbi:3-oxoacyl-[acyl-carrier-protein] synthase III C-terminal domain-containing protein [Lignipirellula cremea]|uniref:3-oxoacyl-[acyl-carrier-protein] synthase 3 n=1 Tax=Lignipirellula cremea TaxID=2528010 RepID=A0A518DZI6_9BACT|nr:3-oxoacyl-[acyl-carrier-protein] synthase III C-terminal domain-containing protein [Lignipirellula cremea]QDU97260.1 3-oxoacyl-[acyl-carrier-protein] synthase 3 [Lignipirellula cremea]
MRCYLTRTAAFLPGPAIENDQIESRLGALADEAEVKTKILAMNGISRRHYAQDEQQRPTHDVYALGAAAAAACLGPGVDAGSISLLSAGTTFAPLAAPGYASLLHSRLADQGLLTQPVEIASHAGICSSAASALVGAIRAVAAGEHRAALAVGAEHASDVLKASVIRPVDDRAEHANVRSSRWFMSVFLRFMLSDGAGAFLLQQEPNPQGLSLQVNWTHARSFAHAAPLCMQLESRTGLLSQDLGVLSKHLIPSAGKFLGDALQTHQDTIDSHAMILPHMSSYFFRRKMEKVIAQHCQDPLHPPPYWTNLATAGNTGAASIFVMLDEYLQRGELRHGDRILLFVPESGQFNFVLISLTAVLR